ncbi:PIG-L deacetylase family protein [Lentzea roselyniae]
MMRFDLGQPDTLVLLGAHCDDIAIGAGGLLLSLCRRWPGIEVRALVLTGMGTEREMEEQKALASLCPRASLDLTVLDLPDGRMPSRWEEVKSALEVVRSEVAEQAVVIGPHRGDAHQDHRCLAEIVPSVFRGHLLLGYEIVKWDADLGQPSVFFPLDDEVAEEKVEVLHAHYRSQFGRQWFDREAFLGLARLRGVQSRSRYAEAFYTDKVVLGGG